MEGHGIAGRYAGLEDPYGVETFAKVVLQPIPFDLTSTYKSGSDKGPAALIEASRNMELYDIETDSEVFLKGIYTAPPVLAKTPEEMIEKSYKTIKKFLSADKFVVTLGGEHTISYPAIKAHFDHYQALTVLQFDAHADLYPAYENNPFSHASVMSRVLELPANLVSVGIRSLSSEENKRIDRSKTFFAHELHGNWIDRLMNLLNGPIYITFDLDAFDSSLMPSTGTPEPGGLDWNLSMQVLKRVFREKKVVGFDIVELCPSPHAHAPDYLAAKLLYKMLSYKFI